MKYLITTLLTIASVRSNDLQNLDAGFEEVDEFSHESLNYSPQFGLTDQSFKNLSVGLWHSLDSSPHIPTDIPVAFDLPPHHTNKKHKVKHQKSSSSLSSSKRHQRHKKTNIKAGAVTLDGGNIVGGKLNYSKKTSQQQRGQRLKNNKNGNLFPDSFTPCAFCNLFKSTKHIMVFLL